jgi:hypothetical protein
MDGAGGDVKVEMGAEEAGDFLVSMPFASELADGFTVRLECGTARLTA